MIVDDKKYSISEVSKITGYEPHVLRYYENNFNLDIPRTETNRRYYTSIEIEKIIFIKELQEKGLTNKQIKLILETPEVLVNETNQELAITNCLEKEENTNELACLNNDNSSIKNICNIIVEELNKSIDEKLTQTKKDILNIINQTKESNIAPEKNELPPKDKDILLCENARLKMKLKEKSYELAEAKDKLKRYNTAKTPFWKKIFS